MNTIVLEEFNTHLAAIKERSQKLQCGLFELFVEDSTHGDRFFSAVVAVIAAMGDELHTIAAVVESVVLCKGSIDANQLTDGICVGRGSGSQRNCTVIIEANAVASISDNELRHLIAHEFRHAWQFATNFRDSELAVQKLREASLKQMLEDDANEYAERLGFFPEYSLKLAAFGFPEDSTFRTVLLRWPQLSTEQKEALAEFFVFNTIHWRDIGKAIGLDARLLGIVYKWDNLGDSDRNKIEEFIQTKVSE